MMPFGLNSVVFIEDVWGEISPSLRMHCEMMLFGLNSVVFIEVVLGKL
jgi:hypothetical protein